MTAQLVFLALTAAERAIELFMKLRAAAKQAGELTPEQEQELDAHILSVTSQNHWKIEP